MPKHKSEDYKLSAVEYYLESGDTMRKLVKFINVVINH